MIWNKDNNGLVCNGPTAKSVSGRVKGYTERLKKNKEEWERKVENK